MTLHVNDLVKRFGGLAAVDGVSFVVEEGERLGIIGANGSGKTTTVNLLTRVDAATEGSMLLDDVDYTRLPAQRLARLGIARTFQNLRLFHDLTIFENVALGWQASSRSTRVRAGVMELLETAGVHHLADRSPHDLPYGTQRVVEIARALAVDPRILFLDEPFAGMSTEEAGHLGALLLAAQDRSGLALVIIDHNLDALLGIVTRMLAFGHGRILAEGSAASVIADPLVVDSYVGSTHA